MTLFICCSVYIESLCLKCCLGGDIPRDALLDSLAEGLESCKRSLGDYLDAKRQVRISNQCLCVCL